MGGTSGVIPRNIAAYLGGFVDEKACYAFWKDGNLLVIQAETIQDPNDPKWSESHEQKYKLVEEQNFHLELIQRLLSCVEFGKTNWAYLIRGSGGYRIVQKERSLYKISCPLWASLIHEDEIEVTKWVSAFEMRGVWNGKTVDILYGWNDYSLKRVDDAMHGLRAIGELDLTFEVYGHLIGRNGEVVGIVSEAAWGQKIALCDRTLVYETFATLQEHGCLFVGINSEQVLIANGKVRLLDLYGIRSYPEDDREKMAEGFHWQEIECVFAQLESGNRLGFNQRFWYQTPRMLLPPTPSPERPRLMRFMLLGFGGSDDRWIYDLFGEIYKDRSSRNRGTASKRHQKPVLHDDIISPFTFPVDALDIALSGKAIALRHRKRSEQIVSYALFHPYRQKFSPSKMLLGNYNSDATSDSEASISGLSSI